VAEILGHMFLITLQSDRRFEPNTVQRKITHPNNAHFRAVKSTQNSRSHFSNSWMLTLIGDRWHCSTVHWHL